MRSERLPLPARTAAVWQLTLQFGRFVLVGVAATLVHVLAYTAAVAWLAQSPQVANVIGFALGVNVSFLGHRHWTFAGGPQAAPAAGLARFWAVALLGFALNALFVQLVTVQLGLAYYWAIPLFVGVTPLVTFSLSRGWAFRA